MNNFVAPNIKEYAFTCPHYSKDVTSALDELYSLFNSELPSDLQMLQGLTVLSEWQW